MTAWWSGGGRGRAKMRELKLGGGGLFRWLTRGMVVVSLLLTLALRYLLGMHIILAALAGFTALLLGLLVPWVLVVTDRIKVRL